MAELKKVKPTALNLLGLVEGLQIFAKYDPDGSYAAEHDIIYVADSNLPITDAEKKRLKELSFHIDEGLESWYINT